MPATRWLSVSGSVWITSFLFGFAHLFNLAYQPWIPTLIQCVVASLLGLLFGQYYDKTHDFAGTAWLHNLYDGIAVLTPWILFLIR
ncbi:MAG: CPBP family glutamic-type intramembrane protease [Bacilli bacterium]